MATPREADSLLLLPDTGLRTMTASALRTASRALDTLAGRLSRRRTRPETDSVIEFYGEAGAPEGALYVNGQLVGRVPGVNRL